MARSNTHPNRGDDDSLTWVLLTHMLVTITLQTPHGPRRGSFRWLEVLTSPHSSPLTCLVRDPRTVLKNQDRDSYMASPYLHVAYREPQTKYPHGLIVVTSLACMSPASRLDSKMPVLASASVASLASQCVSCDTMRVEKTVQRARRMLAELLAPRRGIGDIIVDGWLRVVAWSDGEALPSGERKKRECVVGV